LSVQAQLAGASSIGINHLPRWTATPEIGARHPHLLLDEITTVENAATAEVETETATDPTSAATADRAVRIKAAGVVAVVVTEAGDLIPRVAAGVEAGVETLGMIMTREAVAMSAATGGTTGERGHEMVAGVAAKIVIEVPATETDTTANVHLLHRRSGKRNRKR
jgi:hypothetical protein